jgi:beta-xylosidase
MNKTIRRILIPVAIAAVTIGAALAIWLSLRGCAAGQTAPPLTTEAPSPSPAAPPETSAPPDKPDSTAIPAPAVKKPPIVRATDTTESPAPRPADPIVAEDDFTATVLDPRWFWVRENPGRWSLTEKPGYLSIVAESGELWENFNNNRNMLLMNAPAADFQLDTRVMIQPLANHHQAGLVVYRDDDNYVKLIRIYSDGNKLELFRETGGKGQEYQINWLGSDIWLRLVKSGARFTAYYSENGTDYLPVAETTNNLGGNLKIGLFAFHSNAASNVTVRFDFFRVSYRRDSLSPRADRK